jgi:hypothetical protein
LETRANENEFEAAGHKENDKMGALKVDFPVHKPMPSKRVIQAAWRKVAARATATAGPARPHPLAARVLGRTSASA